MELPNGDKVPDPCDDNGQYWPGVGHKNHIGGGARNPFGEAFAKNDFKWTNLLCRADSDGDGFTNGEELGDPDCNWVPGSAINREPRSHPGICEPLDDPVCVERNYFLSCHGEPFECDVLNESETFPLNVRIPVTQVPVRATTTICVDFEFPYVQEHHLVATVPLLDKQEVAHSIHVYACANGHSRSLMSPYECETESMACENLIAVWRKGLEGECHGSEVGIPVGGSTESGYRYATLQLRWNNPSLKKYIRDASGLGFFLTPTLRPRNAGYFYFGPRYLVIPPGRSQHSIAGRLDGKCTREVLQGPVTILKVMSQMHMSGQSQETTLVRDSKVVNYLAVDDPYSWDRAQSHTYPEGVEIFPGDELLTACKYKTSNKAATTFWGEGYEDEKCFAYMMYYPKENIVNPHFKSWGSISYCDMRFGTAQGCDVNLMKNPNHSMRKNVKEKCRPGMCLEECLEYVRDVKKESCFRGDVNKYLRMPINMTSEEILEHTYHYAALDSCDVQLTREQCVTMSGTSTAVMHVAFLHVILVCQELFVILFDIV